MMKAPRALFALALLALSGCAGAPAPASHTGVPAGWHLVSTAALAREAAPDPLSPTTLEWVQEFTKMTANVTQAPLDGTLSTYGSDAHPSETVRVYDLLYAREQGPGDWKAVGEEDGWGKFYGLCGLRPYYAVLAGTHAHLIVGADSGSEVPLDTVYVAALELHDTLVAAGGRSVCGTLQLQAQRNVHRVGPGGGDGREPNNDRAHAFPTDPRYTVMQDLSLPVGDVDWFAYSFAGASNVTFVASTEGEGLALRLTAADGRTLATAAPTEGRDVGTAICIDLPAGSYALEVRSASGAEVRTYSLYGTVDDSLSWGVHCRARS
jgi:hypothetical protein